MKLELKHLVGYLPYGLKFDISHTEYGIQQAKRLKSCELISLGNSSHIADCSFQTNIESQNAGMLHLNIDVAKPILRPLSDLTKEIEVNGKKFVPIKKLMDFAANYSGKWVDVLEQLNKYYILSSPYEIVEKLYEWHFDIHGLIKENLAIDINTL